MREQFSGFDGFIVSPSVPFVRQRVQAEIERWHTEVPADCLFFYQIGARPWRRDFNPAASSVLGYEDAWLSLFAPYADRCLMVEDGWDRLAASFSGFDGSLIMMQREFNWLDDRWGDGNWQSFPLALWLFHDKVLLYQHDLYPDTMTGDAAMLTWNAAFGYVLSFDLRSEVQDGSWAKIATPIAAGGTISVPCNRTAPARTLTASTTSLRPSISTTLMQRARPFAVVPVLPFGSFP